MIQKLFCLQISSDLDRVQNQSRICLMRTPQLAEDQPDLLEAAAHLLAAALEKNGQVLLLLIKLSFLLLTPTTHNKDFLSTPLKGVSFKNSSFEKDTNVTKRQNKEHWLLILPFC